MKVNQITKGNVYEITVGKNKTAVKVLSIDQRVNGQTAFDCMNVKTNKRLIVTDPKRFVREIKPEKPKTEKSESKQENAKGGKPKGRLSGLDAAHRVLLEAGRPMNAREITETAMRNGYCDLQGKTPAMTISAAIQRELKTKGEVSRFVKADRGQFAAR